MEDRIAESKRLAQERLKQSRLKYANVNNVQINKKHKIGEPFRNENSAKRFCEALEHVKLASAVELSNQLQNTNKAANAFNKMMSSRPIECKCEMISDTHFQFTHYGYYEPLIQLFKTIPSKVYDPKTKIWKFHVKDYVSLINKIQQGNLNVNIDKIPAKVIKICMEPKDPPADECLKSLEPKLLAALMPFQRDGVKFGIQKKGRCMIADEMGLGKTYQALAIADFYRDDMPMLICTTATTRSAWHKKLIELLPYVPCNSVVTLTTTKDYFRDAKVIISSYALLEKISDKILEMNVGIVIMDESHTLKNSKAKCTQVALKIARKVRRVILLTGTPALSRPVELFTQLQMLNPNIFHFKEFTIRYCEGEETDFGWTANGADNLTELNVVLNKKFMVRRIKTDVMAEFSEKHRELVELNVDFVNENPEHVEILTQIAEELKLSKDNKRDHNMILLKYYSETAKIKVRAVW